MNTLVVISHPKPTSLTRAAADRVLAGLARTDQEVRVLDLDRMGFDPVLRLEEVRGHLGEPEDRPDLVEHLDALRWCDRLVLVYPTWFSGQPAMLKGWFDRVWMHRVAFELPDGSARIRGTLQRIRRIDVVTSHGSSRRVNLVQGNSGRLRVNRTLRILCARTCITRWRAIYDIDNKDRAAIESWLDGLESAFSQPPRLVPALRLPWPGGPRGGP
ncbi:MAG: NAD(P)H-dependent oxidoreductase [Actinomycetota bacterium]